MASLTSRLWARVFAATYDRALDRTERRGNVARRAALLADAYGVVVELGAGTGLNLPHYPAGADLILTEPEEPMARRLEARLRSLGRSGQVLRAPAEALPLADASADTVVSTLVLCTVDDLDAALAETRRVLRPDGQLLFLEHVAAPDGSRLRRVQDLVHGPWHALAAGCHDNRDTEAALVRAGFAIEEISHERLEAAPPPVLPLIVGRATPPRTPRS
jgi:ubiquinone/menaquinone biosynthesis C-methylase UbiE